MKFLAVVMAFVVVWLSVAPPIPANCPIVNASVKPKTSCCQVGHCSKTAKKQTGKATSPAKGMTDGSTGGICSPFLACSFCSFLKPDEFLLPEPATSVIQSEKVRLSYIGSLSYFFGDFFQPPEWMI